MTAPETYQTLKVIIVAMTEHESIERGWIIAEEINIVDQRRRCVTEVDEGVFDLGSMPRLAVAGI